MGNYAARRTHLTGWQIDVAWKVFQGYSDEQIAIEVLNADKNDPKDFRRKKDRIRSLLQTKQFNEFYQSMIKEWMVHNAGKALCKLSQQVDHEQPWLANKAANDILNRIPKSMLTEEDESTIHIVVEGAPELGTPDGDA